MEEDELQEEVTDSYSTQKDKSSLKDSRELLTQMVLFARQRNHFSEIICSLSTLIFERLDSVAVKVALRVTLHKEASKPGESTQQGISPLRGNPFVA